MEGDPFLKDRWKEKAAHERGEEGPEARGLDLYYSFMERAQKDPEFRPLMDELEKSVGDYADSIIRLSRTKMDRNVEAVTAADDHRTRMHQSVIDAANRISRWYGTHKLTNSWRRDIIGLDRKDLGAWAASVARHILGKSTEEE